MPGRELRRVRTGGDQRAESQFPRPQRSRTDVSGSPLTVAASAVAGYIVEYEPSQERELAGTWHCCAEIWWAAVECGWRAQSGQSKLAPLYAAFLLE